MRQTNVIDRTSDEIEVWLAASEQVISRIRTEQMALLREAARRQLPLADGCRSLAEWAAGRMDMSTPAARTLSSTAQRLAGLPLIEEAAAAGNLSYERTVEVARLATADAQGETLDEVRHLDIGGLRRRAAQRRRLTRSDERAIAEAEHVVLRPNLDESRWDIWGTVGGYHGRVIDKALTVRGDRLPTPPEGMRVSLGKRKADALVSVCQDSLDGTGPAGGPSPPLVRVARPARSSRPVPGSDPTPSREFSVQDRWSSWPVPKTEPRLPSAKPHATSHRSSAGSSWPEPGPARPMHATRCTGSNPTTESRGPRAAPPRRKTSPPCAGGTTTSSSTNSDTESTPTHPADGSGSWRRPSQTP